MLLFKCCKPLYTRLRYFNTFGEVLRFRKKEKDIHEKLFWLSVFWRDPLISVCADKYRVREYVKTRGCGDMLNELYQVADSFDKVDFDALPNGFVMKSNKGSGDNFFCLDKTKLDKPAVNQLVNTWKSRIYGYETAEYQYAGIPFKLILEKYLSGEGQIIEYQLFCFNGEPESILVRTDLETSSEEAFAVSYSLDWKRLYYRIDEEQFSPELERPVNLDKMIDYARRLAKPFPHVRVDYYEYQGRLYFGEMTFSTHGNVLSNYKPETLDKWGRLLQLPQHPFKRNTHIEKG